MSEYRRVGLPGVEISTGFVCGLIRRGAVSKHGSYRGPTMTRASGNRVVGRMPVLDDTGRRHFREFKVPWESERVVGL